MLARDRLVPRQPSPLTVIHAPAGYGKTTLALQIIGRDTTSKSCWLSVDELDNDPSRFWSATLGALRTVCPSLSDSCLQLFNGTDDERAAQALQDVVVTLLNALHSRETPNARVSLVIDDFHHLGHPGLLQSINQWLDHLPSWLCVIVTSRDAPALRLAHRLSKGRAHLITAYELRFTEDEAHVFFDGVNRQHPLDSLRAVIDQCEGWAAALKLYGLAEHGAQSIQKTQNNIHELLLDEVLHTLPKALRDFLGQTSFLPRFCPALINHTLQTDEADARIQELIQRNLFVSTIEAGPIWLRYHDLFRTLVMHRFAPPRTQLARLRHRAAEWFEAHGHHTEALSQYVASHRWAPACRLLIRIGSIWMRAGQTETLRQLLQQIPVQAWQQHAELVCLHVWLMPDADKHSEGHQWLDRAAALLDKHAVAPEKREAVRCEVLTLRALVARLRGQWEQTQALSRAALESAEATHLPLRWRSFLTLGASAYTQGNLTLAAHNLQEAVHWAQQENNPYGVVQSCGYLSETLYQRGELRLAQRVAQRVQQQIESSAWGAGPLAAWRWIGLIDLYREQDALDEAWHMLQELNRLRQLQTCESLQHLIIALRSFTLAISRRDYAHAQQSLDDIETLPAHTRFHAVYAYGSLDGRRAELACLIADMSGATRWVESYLQRHQGITSFCSERDEITAIRILHLLKRDTTALRRVSALRAQAAQSGHVTTEALCLIWQAICLHALAKSEAARAALIESFDQIAEAGYKRLFLDQGASIKPVLAECCTHKVHGAFAFALLEQLQTEGQKSSANNATRSPTQPSSTPPLSRREIEMLQHVRQGLSDKEIAHLTHISLGTVKTHLRNIYRKLDAKSRIQALARLHADGFW